MLRKLGNLFCQPNLIKLCAYGSGSDKDVVAGNKKKNCLHKAGGKCVKCVERKVARA